MESFGLVLLCLLAARCHAGPTAAPATTPAPANCTCHRIAGTWQMQQQLIRGPNEVQLCNQQSYCNCKNETQLSCPHPHTAFNPDQQKCLMGFDCAAWLADHPLPTFCQSCGGWDAPRYQLNRGPDEEELCNQQLYCDCATKTQLKCPHPHTTFNPDPDQQRCMMGLDCTAWLAEIHAPDPDCEGCVDDGPRFQLIRGFDEVDRCKQRQYCDCKTRTVNKCPWPLFAFNQDRQGCWMFFNCASWLGNHPTPTPAAPATAPTTPTTRPTVPPTTSTAPSTSPTTTPTTPSSTSPTAAPTTPRATTPAISTTTVTASPTTPMTPDPYCLSCSGEPRYQLIRGPDELDKCNRRMYCDCLTHTQAICAHPLTTFNPDFQDCQMGFNCAAWFRWLNSTTTTPRVVKPTPIPSSTPNGARAQAASAVVLVFVSVALALP